MKRLQLLLRLWLALFAQQVDTNGPFQVRKRRQFLIGMHNKAPSVVAVRIDNPDRVAIGLREAEFPLLCVLYSATLSQ